MSARQPALTTDEKTRLPGPSTVRSYLLPTPTTTVFAAAVITSVGSFPISEVGIGTLSGNWAGIREGQTVWIGTAAGLKDIYVGYIRFVFGTSTLYISESGQGDAGALTIDDRDTPISVGHHVTVFESYTLQAARSRIAYTYGATNATFYKKHDRGYGTQNEKPLPYFQGDPHKAYRLPTGDSTVAISVTVTAVPHKAGQTVTGHSWSYPASLTGVSGSTTATLSASAPLGFHVLYYQATLSDGVIETAIRYVWIYNATNVIELTNPSIDRQVSGQTYTATLADDLRGDIDTESMFMVVEEQTWTGGAVATATTKFIGYLISGSGSAQYGRRGSQITLVGPGQMLAALGNDSQQLDVATTPVHFQQAIAELMTARYMVHYLLCWHVENWNQLHCYYPDTTTTQSNSPLKVNEGSVWSQIEDLVKRARLGVAGVDSDGDLHFGGLDSHVDPASRGALVTRDDDLDQDTIEDFTYQEQDRPPVRRTRIGAFTWDGTTQDAIRSVAPSRATGQGVGKTEAPSIIIADQDDLDLLVGLEHARSNRRIKTWTFTLIGNRDVYEPAHRDRVYYTIPALHSPTGAIMAAYGRVIGVSKTPGADGAAVVKITVEPETSGRKGEPDPYPAAGGGSSSGGARPFGVRAVNSPKAPTRTVTLPARQTTFGPSTAPNSKLRFWLLAKDASGSGFRVVDILKTGASTWVPRDISPTSAQRTTLGAPVKLIEMKTNVKGLILLCESGVAYTNDYTAKTVTWFIGWNTATSPTTQHYDFSLNNQGFTAYTCAGDCGNACNAGTAATYGSGRWDNVNFVCSGENYLYIYKDVTAQTITSFRVVGNTSVDIADAGAGTALEVRLYGTGGTVELSRQRVAVSAGAIDHTFNFANIANVDRIWAGLSSYSLGGTQYITQIDITGISGAIYTADIMQSGGGNIYWLSKAAVSGTDYIFANYTRNNFKTVNSTQIAKYDSALTYNIQIDPSAPANVWVSAGTTSDATAAIWFSSNGAVSFTAGAALNTRGGAFRLPRTIMGGNPNKRRQYIVYVKGISTNLQGVRDGSSAATIASGSSDYPKTADTLVSYPKDGAFVALILKSKDVYKSDNGGLTWAYVAAAPGTGEAYCLAGWYNNHKLLLAAGDQVLAYSEDRAATWSNLWSTYETWRASQYGGTVAQIIISAGFGTYPTFTKPVL